MPISSLVVLVVFGIVVVAVGARMDMKNHKKEKAVRETQNESGR
jgi:hypothetical protein